MSNPITYDMREKFKKKFEENKNLNIFKFIDNILEEDFNTLAKENKELVDDMKIYLNQNKFNKFYFYSIYELMYNEKLNMFIIDNKQKTYDIQYPKIKYSYDLIFYEHINDKKINNFFSTYLNEIFLKPFVEQKKIELKDKYDSYEENLFKKKNLVKFEEKLLIYNYEKDNLKKKNLGGNIIFGMRGGIKFNINNNNIDKIYF